MRGGICATLGLTELAWCHRKVCSTVEVNRSALALAGIAFQRTSQGGQAGAADRQVGLVPAPAQALDLGQRRVADAIDREDHSVGAAEQAFEPAHAFLHAAIVVGEAAVALLDQPLEVGDGLEAAADVEDGAVVQIRTGRGRRIGAGFCHLLTLLSAWGCVESLPDVPEQVVGVLGTDREAGMLGLDPCQPLFLWVCLPATIVVLFARPCLGKTTQYAS